MSLITNRQQELIDTSISQSLSVLNKVSEEYLTVRRSILQLSAQVASSPDVSVQSSTQVKQLELDLDLAWESYRLHLREIRGQLDIINTIKSRNLDQLNSEYEAMLAHKINLNSRLKNIKDIQLPLLEQMNKIQNTFGKNLSRTKCRKFASKNGVIKVQDDLDFQSIIYTKQQLIDLMSDFDSKIQGLTTIYDLEGSTSKSLKSSEFIANELSENGKFMELDNDEYLFRLSRSTQQDGFMATASVEDYDEMIEKLTNEIVESINFGTKSKENWMKNAGKFDRFRKILESAEPER